MTERKHTGTIVFVILLAIAGVGIYFMGSYYQDRYQGSDYYVLTPKDLSTDLEQLKDDSGNIVDVGKNYIFEGYNEAGERRELEWSFMTQDVEKLIKPNTYWRVSASKQIVVGQEEISKSEVPTSVLKYLE